MKTIIAIFIFTIFSNIAFSQYSFYCSWTPDSRSKDYIVFLEFRDSIGFTLQDNMDFKKGAEDFVAAFTQDTSCVIEVESVKNYVVYGVVGFDSDLEYGPISTIEPFYIYDLLYPRLKRGVIVLPVLNR